jgi:hypothetical protein
MRDHPKAFSFVIAPCRELDDEMTARCLPEDAHFWTLYGTVPPVEGEFIPSDDLDGLQMAIFDFETEAEALDYALSVSDGRPIFRNVKGYHRLEEARS